MASIGRTPDAAEKIRACEINKMAAAIQMNI